MDQETRENLNMPPEPDAAQERPRKAKKKKPLRKFRKRCVAARNGFCRAVRTAFDTLAACCIRVWAVIGPAFKKMGHGIAVGARAVWKVVGPVLKRLWAWMKPGVLFLGNRIKAGASCLATRFRGLNKAMQIGIGAVSGSLVLLVIALMVSAHVSRTAMKAARATPEGNVLPVVSETEAPTAAPTASPIPEPLLGEIMKKGDDSPTVAIVQTRLMELGYMDSDEPTEHFGSITEAALIRFQKHNDLKADGQIGETTWNLLMNEGVPECVMQDGDQGDDVQDVQNRLYELGYLAKSFVTGTYGEKTSAAVSEFQKANSIAPTGQVGHETLDVLYADDVVGNFFSRGETNDTIATYQEKLKKLGYLASTYKVKGKMDDATIAAIRKFQDNNDLTPDGCLGPTTMTAMDSKDAKAYTLKLGMSGSDVKTVQKRLKALGYLKTNSEVNGYYGETTEDAVEEFQRRNNLSADGTVGPKTLEKLNSSSAKKAATAKPTAKPTPKATAKPKTTKKATTKPGTKATAKATAKSGTKATAKATAKSNSGKTVDTSNKKGVEKMIAIAESKIGCPYSGGAKGPNRFDCSGFVYYCMKQAGFSGGYMTSRTWRTTSRYKRITSMSQIQRGDILVFKGNSTATGHVGIYLGGGKMIDASSGAGQVRVTNSVLSGTYWKQHFLMAYRISG